VKPLLVFGAGEIAELVAYLFETDHQREVVAFTVDEHFLTETELRSRPVVPSNTVLRNYPPAQYDMFIAIGYGSRNSIRAEKFSWARSVGYTLPSYVSSGASTFPDFSCGDNCLILEDNTIQPFVELGNNITLWSGNHIGHHSKIEDHVFIASHVVVSGGVTVGERSFIGVNATIRDHLNIGTQCIIGAGALLMSDAEDGAVYRGDETLPKGLLEL